MSHRHVGGHVEVASARLFHELLDPSSKYYFASSSAASNSTEVDGSDGRATAKISIVASRHSANSIFFKEARRQKRKDGEDDNANDAENQSLDRKRRKNHSQSNYSPEIVDDRLVAPGEQCGEENNQHSGKVSFGSNHRVGGRSPGNEAPRTLTLDTSNIVVFSITEDVSPSGLKVRGTVVTFTESQCNR